MNTETAPETDTTEGAASGLNAGLWAEGFYEKMWKDFCSLQRGDVTRICKDAERYQWLKKQHQTNAPGWAVRGKDHEPLGYDLDKEIDSAMEAPNVSKLSDTPKGR